MSSRPPPPSSARALSGLSYATSPARGEVVPTERWGTLMATAKTAPRPRAAKEAAPEKPTAKAFLERLHANATEAERKKYVRYFPPAERRPGDTFIGVRMGTVFELARAFIEMAPAEIGRASCRERV